MSLPRGSAGSPSDDKTASRADGGNPGHTREDKDQASAAVEAEENPVNESQPEKLEEDTGSVKSKLREISSDVIQQEKDERINSPSGGQTPATNKQRSPEEVKDALLAVSKDVLTENTFSNDEEEVSRQQALQPKSLEEVAQQLSGRESSGDDSMDATESPEFSDSRPPLSEEQNTKLLRAAFDGDITVAQALLFDDYNLNGTDRHGWTALHWSASRGHYAFTKMLLEKRCNVNAREKISEWTPLHIAAINQRLKISSLLIEFGASKSIKDRWGDYPADCADRPLKGKRGKLQREMKQVLMVRSRKLNTKQRRTDERTQ